MTHIMIFTGTFEETERSVKIAEQVFRHFYNVYGAKRIESYMKDNEYNVKVAFRANFIEDGTFYSWEEVKKIIDKKMGKLDYFNPEKDNYCIFTEV